MFHISEVTPVDDYDLIFCLIDYFLFTQLNEMNTGGELSKNLFSFPLNNFSDKKIQRLPCKYFVKP